jgi:hypothetical protein
MIDQATLQAATTKLLLDSMSAEDKNALLSKALTTVLTPVRNGYSSDNRSPLQVAFDDAAKDAAAKFISEYFTTPEVQARVKAFVTEAIEKAFTDDFVQKLSANMISGLWTRER